MQVSAWLCLGAALVLQAVLVAAQEEVEYPEDYYDQSGDSTTEYGDSEYNAVEGEQYEADTDTDIREIRSFH